MPKTTIEVADHSPAKPASREALRRAAVTSRPSRMSPEQPRAQRAQCGVKGQCPLSPNGGLCYTICREPHQTGEPWHLSCPGGNLTAKPHVPRAAPRPLGAVWGAGVLPLLLPLPETFGVVVFELAVGGFGKTKGKPFVEQKMEAGEGFRTGKHLAAKIGPGFG